MIVVDTNIIAYLYLEERYSSHLEKLLLIDSEWLAPILWRSEFRNVLSLYFRKGLIDFVQTGKIMREAELRMYNREFFPASTLVLRLLKNSSLSAYDCEFVALAQEMNLILITVDKKILREFPNTAISLEKFVNADTID